MASYATIDQVQSFIPKWKVAGDTNPSTTEVVAFCERLSARIDGIVAAQGYSTPVSGVTSLNIVESICLVGTAWYVGRTLFPNGNVEAVSDYQREFEQMMVELTSGALILVDAARDSSGTSSVLTATTDVLVASAMVPFFTRQMVF